MRAWISGTSGSSPPAVPNSTASLPCDPLAVGAVAGVAVFAPSTCASKQASRSSGVVSLTHSLKSTDTDGPGAWAVANPTGAALATMAARPTIRNARFVLIIVVTEPPGPNQETTG